MREEGINLNDIFYIIKQRWKMIILVTILTTLVAGVFSFYVIKPTYEGRVKIFIGKEGATRESKDYSNNDVTMYQNLMKTYAEIIKTKDSTKEALKSMGKDTSLSNVSRVLSNLTVIPGENTQILDIAYKTGDKNEVINILNGVTNIFIKKSTELIPNGNIKVIQKAEMPIVPVAPNKMLNITIGFLLGLVGSVGLAFLLEYLDNTFKESDELETALDIPVIGIIMSDIKKYKRKNIKQKNKGELECL